jgi:CIC family chloride channel protein
MVAVSVACGLAGALGAVVFRLLIRSVQALFFEGTPGLAAVVEEGILAEAGDPLEAARGLAPLWRLLIPAAGGLLVGPLVYYLAREARGHGVPEVMKAVALGGSCCGSRLARCGPSSAAGRLPGSPRPSTPPSLGRSSPPR